MGKYFGTDGFRGKANVNLTATHAYKTGRFLGWYFSSEKRPAKIVIGKDTRRSGYMFEYSLAAGISSSGGSPFMMHVTTTPSVAFAIGLDDFDCGVMISASHNPFCDNGIKLFNSSGEKVSDELISKIESYIDGDVKALGIDANDIPLATGDKIGKINDYFSGRLRYIAFLNSIATHSYKGVRVGLDTANGAAYYIAKNVFESLGAKVFTINDQPDGLNINLNCGSTHIEGLSELVRQNDLDVGFAFDGDADRCLAVDENGKLIDGDAILYICASYLKEKDKLESNTVVATVMSNMGLVKSLGELGIDCVRTDVGDRFVYEQMVKGDNELGGEQSGHTIFRKYSTTGDGILTAMMIMEAVINKHCPVSSLVRDLQRYPQLLKNVRVSDKKAALADTDVVAAVNIASQSLGDDGRVLIRTSGTEPLVRIMVEAKSDDLCEKHVEDIYNAIKSKGYIV